MRFPARLFAVLVLLWTTASVVWASPRAGHVFIISIDGGKPAAIAQSAMPVLKRLAAEGAYTWDATTIFPSITLPSHTSMLTGVTPEKHHILWNSWKPRKGVVGVPTIFAEAKKAGFSTAMFVGKEKFRHLLQPGTVDEFDFGPDPVVQNGAPIVKAAVKTPSTFPARIVALTAARYIVERKPNLCFIHFPDPDTAGHKHGWGSPQQLKALADVDAALGEVLQAIDSAGIRQDSVLMITADHGGHGRTHGSKRPDDMHIPWIAWGRNVKRDYSITTPVNTCDTAATALWLLDVPCPDFLDGRPVTSAFARRSQLANTRKRDRVTAH